MPSQCTEPIRTSKGYWASTPRRRPSGLVEVDLEADLHRQPFVLRQLGKGDVLIERVAGVKIPVPGHAPRSWVRDRARPKPPDDRRHLDKAVGVLGQGELVDALLGRLLAVVGRSGRAGTRPSTLRAARDAGGN